MAAIDLRLRPELPPCVLRETLLISGRVLLFLVPKGGGWSVYQPVDDEFVVSIWSTELDEYDFLDTLLLRATYHW